MIAGLIAVVLAGSAALIEGTHSTDSIARARATYALARTHAREDGTAAARVELLLTTGATDLRLEVVRGLTSRGWRSFPPEIEAKLVKLLGDPDLAVRLAVVDGMRHLPRPRAADLLLAEEPHAERRGPGGAEVRARILQVGMEIGDARFKPLLARTLHPRTESLAWRRDCSLARCLEELTAMAWMGEDVGFALTRGSGDWRPTDVLDAMRVLRIQAAGGKTSAIAQLAADGRAAMDQEDRRRILGWLLALPPTLRTDLSGPLARFAGDPDPVVRERTLRAVSAASTRLPGADAILAAALTDGSPEVRLEAAVGLFDGRPGKESASHRALTRARATEPDPAVKAAIDAALASTY